VVGVTGVVTVVKVGAAPVAIADEEIENIRLLATALDEHGLEPELEPYAVVGARVRVGAGPLAGVEGVVVQRRGRARVLVGLAAVGQGISVEVDSATLELVEEARPAKAG
jgi:transcription antitermination factor NusG